MKKFILQLLAWVGTVELLFVYFKMQDDGLIRFLPMLGAFVCVELYAALEKKYP